VISGVEQSAQSYPTQCAVGMVKALSVRGDARGRPSEKYLDVIPRRWFPLAPVLPSITCNTVTRDSPVWLWVSRSSWALADLTQSRTTVTPWPWVDY